MAAPEIAGHIVLCGLGKVAISVLRILHLQHIPVVVITRELPPEWSRRVQRWSHAVVLDDDRDVAALFEARVDAARAVIIATDDDVANLETALDCLRIAPDVPIVLRLYDMELAERVRASLPVRAVLNAGHVAAGAFVAAALGRNVLSVSVGDESSVDIAEIPVTAEECGSTPTLHAFAEARGLVPLYLRRSGEELAHIVDPAEILREGDVVVGAILRTTSNRQETTAARGGLPRWPRSSGVGRFLKVMWKQSSPAVRVATLGLAALFVAAIPVYRYGLNLSWLDAVYFTVAILTTVGFGDIALLHASPALKAFGIVTMLGGAVTLVTVLGVVASHLVSLRIEEALGGSYVSAAGHVIVVGIGNIGHRVVSQLHAFGEAVVAIDSRAELHFLSRVPKGVPVLHGDGTDPHVLERAGVANARAVVAVTDSDVVNLRIAHVARGTNPSVQTIVRVFSERLAEQLGTQTLGIDVALNPAIAAAATFAAHALREGVLAGIALEDRLLVIRYLSETERLRTGDGSICDFRTALGVLPILARSRVTGATRAVAGNDRPSAEEEIIAMEEYRRGVRDVPHCYAGRTVGTAAMDD